jgi:hypothetical protein
MFLTHLKTLLVSAVRNTFDSTYPVQEWQNLWCSIEYPIKRVAYPGIWVDYDPEDKLRVIGVGQTGFYNQIEDSGLWNQTLGWRYQGYGTFTIVTLSSWERDRLFDEVVKVFAFGKLNPQESVFRQTITTNDFIAANINFDSLQVSGMSQVGGTPWGSQEIVYEVTLSMQILGEFYSNPSTNTLYTLREVLIDATPEP